MIFIGDIHGQFKYYADLIQNITHTPSVQVGDFAIGFPGYTAPAKFEGNHWFIRGNHDNPTEIRKHPNYLGDYGYRKDWNLFYAGGADSIDKHSRIEGRDWWRDEELDYQTLNTEVLPLFEASRPRLVVTHTCPTTVKAEILDMQVNNRWSNRGSAGTVTENALQAMFEIHQPDVWVFGHYHKYVDMRMDGTRFICLNTFQMIEIEGRDIV